MPYKRARRFGRRYRRRTSRFPRATRLRRRRGGRRRNYRTKTSIVTSRFGTGLPDAFNIKLKYVVGLNVQSTLNGVASKWFRGNGAWDPDPTLGGHEPLDYTNLRGLYRYCRVYASKIKVIGSIVNNNPASWVVCPTADITVGRDIEVVQSDRRARQSRMLAYQGTSSVIVTNYCTTRAIFGLKSRIHDNDHAYDTVHASTTIQPTYEWFWQVSGVVAGGFTTNVNLCSDVHITYYCRFFEKFLPNSTVASNDTGTGETSTGFGDKISIIVADP